jgi:hypothetical protein
MITEIGIVAGEIWHYLDKHGVVTLVEVIKDIDKPRDVTLMSVGWLVREGHIIVNFENEDFKISLRKS